MSLQSQRFSDTNNVWLLSVSGNEHVRCTIYWLIVSKKDLLEQVVKLVETVSLWHKVNLKQIEKHFV